MADKRNDGEMVARLLERLKLVVAVSEEIPTESKLHIQPLIRELQGALAIPEAEQDRDRVRGHYHALLDVSDHDPDVEALMGAVRNFVSYL